MNSQTHNELFGVTRNPWDDSRSPGGSSGGPAVSVACGFSAFELGTDIGGSIRMPAHFTGICGHKPSFGIVPSRGYLDHLGGGLTEADINVVGPMARSVADLGLLLGILAGVDGDRRSGWRLEFPPARPATRLGCGWMIPVVRPTARSVPSSKPAVELLRTDGAVIDIDSHPVDFEESMGVFFPLISSAISPGLPDDLLHLSRQLMPSPNRPVKIRFLPWAAAP